MNKFCIIISFIFSIQTSISSGWGRQGHYIVAEIAVRYLSNNAKANVMKYLDGFTIEEASVWMDEMRNDHSYDYMKPWHYIDIEKGDIYVRNSDENIVNEIILTQNELSHLEILNKEKIKTDILILIHLIGDLHQPLHTGYKIDRGGNSIDLNFLGDATNLHSLWDSKIIEEEKITMDDCLQLVDSLTTEQIAVITNHDIVSWMMESRSYLDSIYSFTGNELGIDYAKKNKPIIEKQLLYAGLRLAALLNDDFGNINRTPNISINSQSTKINTSGNQKDNINGLFQTISFKAYLIGGIILFLIFIGFYYYYKK